MKMESGKPYNIKNLFADDRKIVIPDMQREYCWSDKRHGENGKTEIVSSFLDTLIEYSKSNNLQLGLIYAYENPVNYIYLCDGQQRLTTIYLLVGMLYRRLPENNTLRRILISEYEEKDDFEPRLQYAIRESTLYFLRDLVRYYFMNGEKYISSQIYKEADWFYQDYKMDPSIENIISALDIIEKKINKIFPLNNDSNAICNFANFVTNNLQLFYFDMENRKYGEEQFVVINTTGKCLTFSEVIKPYLLGSLSDNEVENESDKWEKWEKWFWDHKRDDEHESDKGMQRFFEWYLRTKYRKDDVNIEELRNDKSQKTIDELDDYFESLKQLYFYIIEPDSRICLLLCRILSFNSKKIYNESNLKDIFRDMTTSGSCQLQNILLPLIASIVKFSLKDEAIKEDCVYKVLRRLRKNYFSKEDDFKERNDESVDWRDILQMIDLSDSIDALLTFQNNYLIDTKGKNKGCWYSEYEQMKNEFNEKELEEINCWEDHNDFMGDASFIFKSANQGLSKVIKCDCDFNLLRRIYDNYVRLASLYTENKKDLSEDDKILFNNYRLYRYFILNPIVGHLYSQSWNYEGCCFSSYNRKLITFPNFMKLCSSEDICQEISDFNHQYMKELKIFFINESSSTKLVIGAWFALKTLAANRNKKVLSSWDNYGIACYNNMIDNRIFKTKDFDIYNLICGYTKRGLVCYADSDNWNNNLDELFDAFSETISTRELFNQLSEGILNDEELFIYLNHKRWIKELITDYINV